MRKEKWIMMLLFVAVVMLISACGGAEPSDSTGPDSANGGDTSDGSQELIPITQVTNWFPSPERAGQYTALYKGFYEEAGFDMTIESGGPGVSTTQIVATGEAQFGMGQGDDILFARQNGIPVVALAAVFQTNPQALMFHANQNITGFEDLNGYKVYVGAGAPFWQYISKKFELEVEEYQYTGSLITFIEDEQAVTQSYATNEPYVAELQGADVDYLLIGESGYPSYANILYTTEDFLAENPELVKAYVEASIKGWLYYMDNYDEINPMVMELIADPAEDIFRSGAQLLQPFALEGDAIEHGFGYMTEERWQVLIDILTDLELIDIDVEASEVFTTEFIPGWNEFPE